MVRTRSMLAAAVLLFAACSAPSGKGAPDTDGTPEGEFEPTAVAEPGPVELESFDVEAPSGRVRVHASGPHGAPLVLWVHGTPGDWTAFERMLREPFGGARQVAVDRPGFGDSEPDGAVTSLRAQAEALAAVLDGEGPAVVVGHSLGGPIAARLAVDRPDLVRGLVLVAASMDPGAERTEWFNVAGVLFSSVISRELRNANREVLALEPQLRELGDELALVRAPVVLVHGTSDSLVPFSNLAYTRSMLVGAASVETVVLDGEDHFVPWTRPDVVRDAVESLLRRRP
ncbi:MAG: alpha/beta hydrolase [Planctomycetota bacterium]